MDSVDEMINRSYHEPLTVYGPTFSMGAGRGNAIVPTDYCYVFKCCIVSDSCRRFHSGPSATPIFSTWYGRLRLATRVFSHGPVTICDGSQHPFSVSPLCRILKKLNLSG